MASLAGKLREDLRAYDSVVQLAAGEYLVVLPETTSQNAALVAQRLLETAKQRRGERFLAGVAGFPDDGATVEHLLEEVEAALSFARHAGLTLVANPSLNIPLGPTTPA